MIALQLTAYHFKLTHHIVVFVVGIVAVEDEPTWEWCPPADNTNVFVLTNESGILKTKLVGERRLTIAVKNLESVY